MKNFIKVLALGLIMATVFTVFAPCISAQTKIANAESSLNKATITRTYSGDDHQKKETNDSLLEELMPKYNDLRTKISNRETGYNLGYSTADISTLAAKDVSSNWNAELPELREDHPRLLVTKETIPTIRKALEEDTPTNKRFFALLDTEPANDGALGAAKKYTAREDYPGVHNYDDELLELIQIKALGYLVDGHELYGRQAIYYMKQFLRTLDIQYISSCQERQYGNAAFTAALVYDWCYDLLSPADKKQLIAGVENKTLKGYCGDPSQFSSETHKRKMTVDFPPVEYNAIAGSGAEREILRDFLSAAIAFYGDMDGDNKSWWNYVGQLVYSDLIPVRNYYFKSGISHQGTGVYIYGRHLADMYSAWMLQTATGTQPYENLDSTIRSFLGYECSPEDLFSDGDGTLATKKISKLKTMAYISAYLFADEPMLAQARDMLPNNAFKNDSIELTSAMYVALTGMSDITPAEDKYEGMELIQYNGSPVGQYLVHQAWDDPNSANVFMKIKERNAGGHEHLDSGTFMIYYKGMLTADSGVYNQSTSDHTKYYHQATVSHNGLLIFDPSKQNSNSSDKTVKYYSGGQKKPSVLEDRYDDLLSNDYLMAKVIGRGHGYYDSAKTQPKYAYIGGNLTNAYDPTTVDFVGRRMLTVYTGDEDVPMVFFVFDTITADSTKSEKKFLLHTYNRPTADHDKKTVTTTNGDGKLVLTCLTNETKITGVGGRTNGEDGSYSSTLSKNYSVNGAQIPTSNNYDDGMWGRIEISSTNGQKSATFLNSLYVTDKTNSKSYETKPITNVSKNVVSTGDVQGGVFNGSVVAVFANKELGSSSDFLCSTAQTLTKSISFTTSGNGTMTYYVDGLAGGDREWRVTVNGQYVDYVKSSNGILTFEAPAGEVVLKKDSDNLANKRASFIAQVGAKLTNDRGEYTAESYEAYSNAYDKLIYDIEAATTLTALNELGLANRITDMNSKLVSALPELKATAKKFLGIKKAFDAKLYTQDSYQEYSDAYDSIVASIDSATTIDELNAINVTLLRESAELLLKEPLADPDTPIEPPIDPPVDNPTDPPVDDPTDPPVDDPTDPPVEDTPPTETPTDPPADTPEDSNDNSGGEASKDIIPDYTDKDYIENIYSIDIVWTDISFAYVSSEMAKWNPTTHSYDTLVNNSGWSDSSGSITIRNHSSAKVSVSVVFEKASVPNGTAALNISGGEFTLDSALGTTYDKAPSGVVDITARGVPTEKRVIGTIKIKINSIN